MNIKDFSFCHKVFITGLLSSKNGHSLFVVGEWLDANLHTQSNTEMAEETKGSETCMSCFICRWTVLLCTQFLF